MSQREQFLERPLPSSEEAERIVLGCILLDNNLMLQVAEMLLEEEDFYSVRHRKVYKAMLALFGRGDPIEPVLIGEELKKEALLDSVGGIAVITNLSYGLPHLSDLTLHVGIIKKKKMARDLVRICNDIVSETLNEEEEIEDTLDRAEREIFKLSDVALKKGLARIAPVIKDVMKNVEEFSKRESGALLGLATRLTDLDFKMGGMQRNDLIIIAARPSMGKSAMAFNIAQNAATWDKAKVAIFSLEMSKEQLVIRLICSEAKVDSNRFKTGHLTTEEWARIAEAIGVLSDTDIFIDDTPNISVHEIRAKSRRLKAEMKGLDLIVVDYLQICSGSKRTESRQQEVSLIARELKSLAKELDVPVVALSQLSRAPEARNPPRPMMSDLRESGSIEQEADVVAFIYRAEYYKPDDENAGVAEIILAKQRNGPIGTVKLAFLKEFTKFENYFGDGNAW